MYPNDNEMEYFEEAEKEVGSIRKAALRIVQLTHPEIKYVIDRRSIDDYVYKTWDYPGKWYYSGFKLPAEFRTKEDLIHAIAEDSVR
nr:hypothetical protein [Clostridiales bacterium]